MKRFGKCLVAAILSIAMVLGLVPMMSEEAEAAAVSFNSHGDFPAVADGSGKAFNSYITVGEGTSISSLTGWTAVKNYNVMSYYWKYVYNGRTFRGNLVRDNRPDVREAYKKQGITGFSSFTGYHLDSNKSISFSSVPANYTVRLEIYAQATSVTAPGRDNKEFLVGTYNVTVRNGSGVVATAQNELNNWMKTYYSQNHTATGYELKKPGIDKYYLKSAGFEWSHWYDYNEKKEVYLAWCAAFASYCLIYNGYQDLLPAYAPNDPNHKWDRLNCASMRQHWINNNRYVSNYSTTQDGKGTNRDQIWNNIKNKVKPGDLIFFISADEITRWPSYGETYISHHVGIVKSVNTSTKTITYIHGNSNKCNISESTMSINQLHKKMSGVYEILGFGLIH